LSAPEIRDGRCTRSDQNGARRRLQLDRTVAAMTLRQKFVAAFAAVALFVAASIGWVTYGTTERALHNEINVSLATAVSTLAAGGSLSTISLAGTQGPADEHHDDGS